ncbi:MAG: hypothetical protein Q7W05_05575 [Deltaproteobacteria bacterium]|nr:hypothetical protein [Deltaproteobacteria bacterium]
MKHLAVVIDWYGPYTSSEEAIAAAKSDYNQGLYVGIGKRRYEHGSSKPQYIGLSKNLANRLESHQKLPEITREIKLWLGEVATPEPSGSKNKKTTATLDYAEWLHAYFLQLPLNEKKKVSPPPRPLTVLNRWWKKDYVTPWVRRPHPLWPDLIDYIDPDLPAKVVWFGKKQIRVKPPFMLTD